MHELSIAQEIINILETNVPTESYRQVSKVKVKIGKFSNILSDSLQFCFEVVINNSKFSNTKLEIETVPLIIECSDCRSKIEIEPPVFICSNCGSSNINLITGNEMSIDLIEIND